ncbi:MAG: outer membrane beta-barrel protein [Verrucomicrobiota bacterium]
MCGTGQSKSPFAIQVANKEGGVQYQGGSNTTRYTLGASASAIYYTDEIGDDNDDFFWNARLNAGIIHRATRQTTISNRAYLAYEIEPDNSIGASVSRRADQYIYGYNSLSLSHAWSRRFSTVTSLTISGISYDGGAFDGENRISVTLGNQFRYQYNRLTTLVGEHRHTWTDYEESDLGYTGHHFLVGADHLFSEISRGTIRVGAEVRDLDRGGDTSNPYLEASYIRDMSENFQLRWVGRYGLEDSELGSYETRHSFRTALTGNYQFDERTIGTASLTYVHSEFEDSTVAGIDDMDEDAFSLYLGLSYLLYDNVRLNGGYSFTTLSSEIPVRDYDRHRLHLGVTASF